MHHYSKSQQQESHYKESFWINEKYARFAWVISSPGHHEFAITVIQKCLVTIKEGYTQSGSRGMEIIAIISHCSLAD